MCIYIYIYETHFLKEDKDKEIRERNNLENFALIFRVKFIHIKFIHIKVY